MAVQVQDTITQVRPANALVLADEALPQAATATQVRSANVLVPTDAALRQTDVKIAIANRWKTFGVETAAGVGFLCVGLHDLLFSASAIVPASVLPAWQIVVLGFYFLGVSPQLVQKLESKLGTPKGDSFMHTFWMSLFGQLLMVLMAMTLFLALMLVNSVRKRQVQVRKLKVAEDALLAKARTWTKDEPGITASRARLLEKVASDPKLSGTVEFEEWSRIANELPEWLRLYYERIRSENGPLSSKRHLTFAE